MALTWEPRWESVVIEYAGVRIRTCRDRITGMIACPICIDAASICLGLPSSSKYKRKRIEYTFFFSTRDLLLHIKSHGEKLWVRERKEVKPLIEEQQGVDSR